MRLGELCTVVGRVGVYRIGEYLPTHTGELMARVEPVSKDARVDVCWVQAKRLKPQRRGSCEFCPAIGGGCIVCGEGRQSC